MLENAGDGTFTATDGAGVFEFSQFIGGLSTADFNGDGLADVYVGVDLEPNRMFFNVGDGQFEDATTAEIADSGPASGVAVGDVDSDGDLDIFQSVSAVADDFTPEDENWLQFRSLLLLNLGDGQFLDVTEGVGLSGLSGRLLFSPSMLDHDNDGDLDLLAPGWNIREGQLEGLFAELYSNDGTASFSLQGELTESELFFDLGHAVGDINQDGFVDIWTGFNLLENRGNGNHWLRVELVGSVSNRDAVGARVTAISGSHSQTRQVQAVQGRSSSESVVHFGLGATQGVDELEIRWPSGQMDVFTDIGGDQTIRVHEAGGSVATLALADWVVAPPKLASNGSEFSIAIRPQASPTTDVIRVEADLSQLGGRSGVPLVSTGDGTYSLDIVVGAERAGAAALTVLIEQSASGEPQWDSLSRTITVCNPGDPCVERPDELPIGEVVPALQDYQIYADGFDPNVYVEINDGVLDPGATDFPFAGSTALEITTQEVEYEGDRFYSSYLFLDVTVDSTYEYFSFVFHPGDLEESSGDFFGTIDLVIEGLDGIVEIPLLDDGWIDPEVQDWQRVAIPLQSGDHPIGPALSVELFIDDLRGSFYLDDIRLVANVAETPTSISLEGDAPAADRLDQNFPNPFNSQTSISFSLPTANPVQVLVYDMLGQEVITLADGLLPAGIHSIRWNGRDQWGRELASGVYVYRLKTRRGVVATRKLTLLR